MGEIASITDKGPTIAATLDRLARLVDGSCPGPVVPQEARDTARAQALEMLEVCGSSDGAATLAVLGFATELLSAIAVDLAAAPREAGRLIDQIETLAGVPRLALGREVLRTGQVAELPVDVAIEVQLALLLTFTGARAVSLWTLWPSGDLKHVSHAGDFELDAQHTRQTARTLLRGEARQLGRGESAVGIRIERPRPPAGALVARGPHRGADHRAMLLDAAAPTLAALLDRAALLAPDSSSEETMTTSVDRRLARLRFDLHDGPQQDVHLLAEDLRLFREQLRPLIAENTNADRLLGRLDDLDAQLVALDGDLRRLSTAVQSPFLQPGSLPDVLKQITDAFASRTGVEPQTRLVGDLGELTDSQQINAVGPDPRGTQQCPQAQPGPYSDDRDLLGTGGSAGAGDRRRPRIRTGDDAGAGRPRGATRSCGNARAGPYGRRSDADRQSARGPHRDLRHIAALAEPASIDGRPKARRGGAAARRLMASSDQAIPFSSAYRTAPARFTTPSLR